MTIHHISTYRWVDLESKELYSLKTLVNQLAQPIGLKGTILLSPEGINLALAGKAEALTEFKTQLNNLDKFSNLSYHPSYSECEPFQKLFIKIKKHIIPYTENPVSLKNKAPYITPDQLFAWMDAKRDIVLLDARNQYEVEAGGFKNSIHLSLKHFRDFPKHLSQLPVSLKQKTVVTFCTGGIRCEKASATLLEKGFKKVYQLKGGILNYFKKHKEAYYQGGCFVFDHRTVIRANAMLNDLNTVQHLKQPYTPYQTL